MDPLSILGVYYRPGSRTHALLLDHGRRVADRALRVAEGVAHLGPDADFIESAAILHDIGVFLTDAPAIGCRGELPYICHGYLGREILEREGYPRHALVCERHVGAGISLAEIRRRNLPLPRREMIPLSLEERIICYADKFHSKIGDGAAKGTAGIEHRLAGHGAEQVERFREMAAQFGPTPRDPPKFRS